MKSLIEILRDTYNKGPKIEDLYNWKISKKLREKYVINNKGSLFNQNVDLKKQMSKDLEVNKSLNIEQAFMIIQDWGGIRSFKKNEGNKKRLKELYKKILNDEKIGFDCISSLSKVAAFLKPNKYAVYDSRVAFSLNWLICIHKVDSKLFPQPSGRNKILKEYNIKKRQPLQNKNYYSKDEAYHEYCKLLKEVIKFKDNKNGPKTIQDLEMFLFTIATHTFLTNQIRSSLKK